MKPDFPNTSIAFARQGNFGLWRAGLLFRFMAYPLLVKWIGGFLHWSLKAGLPVSFLIKATVYRQFVGGQSLEECHSLVNDLNRFGVQSILDFSVEGGDSEEQMNAAYDETLRSIINASENPNIPFAVFKPSAFARNALLENLIPNQIISPDLQVYLDEFRNYIQNLSQKAAEYDVPLLIDAEDSWYQHLVDEITEEMMSKYNQKRAIVFNTLQMYRHDRLLYLKNLHQKAQEMDFIAGLKFVRGAYMEKERIRAEEMIYPSPIQPDKASTDRDFNEALKYCTRNITRFVIFCGTHNEDSCQLLVSLMEENNFEPADKRFWFSQLYGMSDHISFNLASKGYNVAKYIPYGPVKFVMPYLLRRAEENTSVAGQTSRELSLIQRERMRRSQK